MYKEEKVINYVENNISIYDSINFCIILQNYNIDRWLEENDHLNLFEKYRFLEYIFIELFEKYMKKYNYEIYMENISPKNYVRDPRNYLGYRKIINLGFIQKDEMDFEGNELFISSGHVAGVIISNSIMIFLKKFIQKLGEKNVIVILEKDGLFDFTIEDKNYRPALESEINDYVIQTLVSENMMEF